MKRVILPSAGLGLGFVLFYTLGAPQPQDSGRTLLAGASLDAEVAATLRTACANCHSEQTEWPWYSRLPPASWLIESDIRDARALMNLSHWDEYDADTQQAFLAAVAAAVRTRQMPPSRYTLLHPAAKLSDTKIEQIYEWTRRERRRLRSTRPGSG